MSDNITTNCVVPSLNDALGMASPANSQYDELKIGRASCSKVVEKSDLSEQMNLTNSLRVYTPELVLLRHTPMQTENVG